MTSAAEDRTNKGQAPSTGRVTLLVLVLAVSYGASAAYVFVFSGTFGTFGQAWWRDILQVAVTIGAALALTYISLLVFVFSRAAPGREGEHEDFEWHLLIPCRDEESVIAATVSAARTSFPSVHIWVIDDNSEDATGRIVRGLMDFDPRVHLVPRVLPEARTGKGDALNAAYRELARHVSAEGTVRHRTVVGVLDADGVLSDNALPLLAGPEAFGDDGIGAAQLEVRMRNRGDRRPRPLAGGWKNAVGRFLVRMQDIEFRTANSAMQLLRVQTGTVGMGGNGQFTRLSVLDSLAERHGQPWGRKLSEDYELGLNILTLGLRNHYLRQAYVSQEALPYLRRLFTQRTRWAQGIMECVSQLPQLRRSRSLSAKGFLEIHYFMSQPLIMMFNLVCIPLLLVLALLDGSFSLGGGVMALAAGVFLVAPYALWGPLYRWQAEEPVGRGTAALLGLGYLLYAYFTYVYYPRAVYRLLTGRTGWAKTRRNADDLPTTAWMPAELEALPVLDAEELVAMTAELGGRDDYTLEVVSAYAMIWPRRLANLQLAVAAEDVQAARDAAASIRVSSLMVGAERLSGAATYCQELVERRDFDRCRTSLGTVEVVGEQTVEEIRRQFLSPELRS